jgi:hypothetical protein
MKNFTLQEVSVTLQGSDNEMRMYFDMPSNCTVHVVGAKSIAVNIRQQKDANDCCLQSWQTVHITTTIF